MAGLAMVVVIHRVRPGIGRWLNRQRWLFALAVAASTAVFAWAYIWRPAPMSDLPVPSPGQPVAGALRTAIIAWHFTASLHWFSAYYGLAGLLLAFVGFVVLGAAAQRGSAAASAVFLVTVPVAVLYIARPSISPDQPWAMRRFLPVVIPGIAIAVVFALERGWRFAGARRSVLARRATAAGVVIVGMAAAGSMVNTALPFVTARAQHGAQSAVSHICGVAHDDSAMFVASGGFLSNELPDAVTMYCGIPTATAASIDLRPTARKWHELGRRFLVATVDPGSILKLVPEGKIVGRYVVSDDADPERVFERAPRRFAPVPMVIWLIEIPPSAAS